MKVFFDTSALTKRYVEELGSEQVRALCAEAGALGVSILVVPELISTLCRLVREGRQYRYAQHHPERSASHGER